MGVPQKKEIEGGLCKSQTDEACSDCVNDGYNIACTDWEQWIKEAKIEDKIYFLVDNLPENGLGRTGAVDGTVLAIRNLLLGNV